MSEQRVTELLDSLNGGRQGAFVELVDAVYDDLRRIAAGRMQAQFNRPLDGLTVQPTAIAHEAIMELRQQRATWQNREQFFAIATRLIFRQILQYQRSRLAAKRGGGARGGALEEPDTPALEGPVLDEHPALANLNRLHEIEPRAAEVVTLHVLCGHSLPKVASMLDISLPTAERDYAKAKKWLAAQMKVDGPRP